MPVGPPITKSDTDFRMQQLLLEEDDLIHKHRQFKSWLDRTTDVELTGLGYGVGDIATLRSAWADRDQLWNLRQGIGTLNAAKDFRSFTDRLVGFGR